MAVRSISFPIKQPINGTRIARAAMDQVTYQHIEVPRHDLLLAEGLPAESCLDTGDRAHFASLTGPVTLLPDYAALPNALVDAGDERRTTAVP
jgi:hypothetical protein